MVIPLLVILVSGCAPNEQTPQSWKLYTASDPTRPWQINNVDVLNNSSNTFEIKMYIGTNEKQPDYTSIVTTLKWNKISYQQAKNQLGNSWRLLPHQKFFMYSLNSRFIAWDYEPYTLVSAYTPNNPKPVLVADIIYAGEPGPSIFLAKQPLQMTSIQSNAKNQSITITFQPIFG